MTAFLSKLCQREQVYGGGRIVWRLFRFRANLPRMIDANMSSELAVALAFVPSFHFLYCVSDQRPATSLRERVRRDRRSGDRELSQSLVRNEGYKVPARQ